MLLAALALLSLSAPAHAFTVQTFSPEGLARSPRQVRAVFSEALVPFGDPRGLEPFRVDCSVKGKGLWEDARTWIYEFASELPAGERCAFEARTELKSQKGGAWTGKQSFAFHTGGPAVKRTDPYEGSPVEQQPAFLLALDGPVAAASVEQNVYLLVDGLAERIPVKVLSAKVRDQIRKRGGAYYFGESEDESKAYSVAIESTRSLPPGKKIQLVWGKGVASPKGMPTTEDQKFGFETEKEFEAKFHCERENENAACLPIGEMYVSFSSPITRQDAGKVILRVGKAAVPSEEKKKKSKDEEVSSLRFAGPFPPHAQLRIELPAGLKDNRGRALVNAQSFPLAVRTGDYPPLAKFAAPFGILEAQEPVMPVTVRAVEPTISATRLEVTKISLSAKDPVKVLEWISRLREKHDQYIRYEGETRIDTRGDSLLKSEGEKFELPKPNGAAAFEVVGIPLGSKGFHVVEIGSKLLGASLLGQPKAMYVASGALVTNLAVHFKWGAENSLVWVTSLDKGKPVPGARLRAVDCAGKTLWEGKTDEQGTAVAEDFPSSDKVAGCDNRRGDLSAGVMIVAEKDDDFSLVHSSWDNGIETWRFHLSSDGPGDETLAHTVFDRTLLRAGQTVHMKHFLRERFLRGIRYRRGDMPKNLVIVSASERRVVMPVKFDKNGVAETEWQIPKEAELGGYSVYVTTDDPKAGDDEAFRRYGAGVYQTGSFRVEEFRLPVMAGTLQWPKGALVGATQVSADLHVRYLAGGAAGGLPVKVRARVDRQDSVTFPAFEEFVFANGGEKTGRFNRGEMREESRREATLKDQALTLDAAGGARVALAGLPAWDTPAGLSVEAEYRDPNGSVQTVSQSTVIYPGAALVGIQPDGWVSQQDKVKFRVAVASPEGKPLAGRNVKVTWLAKDSFSHRKRIVGGFYAYENIEEVKEKGPACAGSTDGNGILFCEGKAPVTGNLVLVAETQDGGKKSRAHHDLFVAGADDWWFSQENDDRMDFLPEKKAYEPGDTARFQVRSPFREATALVTVEREGVIDRFVRPVDGKNPVIEVPVKAAYAPNVFVSALLVRGRVADPKATALVDLARPSHKLGITMINVGWKAHRLDVAVDSDKAEYKVREKAHVRVRVTRAFDGKPAGEGEVVLAAVDEALLELLPNRSWNLLDSMMGSRSLKVRTSTAQSQVVGKRHFGLKALPPGGGGGHASARELFDTLLFWKARLSLNGKGEAEADVPMNDSLSSFRIVAIASEDADRFGTGSKTVRTRQDLMLFSGVSPLARLGDHTSPEVTVRNAGDRALQAEVTARVGGAKLGAKSIELAPGASRTLSWSYAVPLQGTQLAFEFEARAGEARDVLKVTQALEPPLRESVLQGTLERVDKKLTMPVAPAKNSLPDTGGVTVKLTRSLAANLDGVKRYMTEYPYDCLEQRVSKAIATRDEAAWKRVAGGVTPYLDKSGLLKYFPDMLWGSDGLTSYVLSVANEAGYAFSEGDVRAMITGLQGFVTGTVYQGGYSYPAADLAIRKLAAMEALSRYQSFDPKYLSLIQVEPDLWPMRAVLDWVSLLRREQKIPNRAKRLAHAEQILRTRVEWRGTMIGFKGASPLWWLMNSGDEDANRFLLNAAVDEQWTNDVGRVVRGSIARQRQGRWDLTTANAWGVLAMERFTERHEKEAVTGKFSVALAGKTETGNWKSEEPKAVKLAWPSGKAELSVTQDGAGRPWAFLEARAAVRLAEPIFKGYQLRRTVTPVRQKTKGKWSTGDVYRVRLEFSASSDMTWVALTDPIPAGASILGSGLGGDSAALTRGEQAKGWGFGHEERSFSGFRSFFEWLPRGAHQVEYTVRLNGAGAFLMPNSRIEAMYAPDMYAEIPNASVIVVD